MVFLAVLRRLPLGANTPGCGFTRPASLAGLRCADSRRLKEAYRRRGRCSVAAMAASKWVEEDKRRLLHVVYRVGDMDATIDYYKKCFGMQLLRYRDIKEEKYTNAFLGYGNERTHFVTELTYNYGVDSYDLGEGFGHFGIQLPDVYKAVGDIKTAGGKVSRDAGPVKGGTTVIAFVEDPTGYKWELIQKPEKRDDPMCQVMLRVGDLEKSIKYYKEALGMQLLRTRENPEYKYTLAFMGYGPEDSSPVMELTYNWGKESYTKGNAYGQIAVSTKDVYKTAEDIKAAGWELTREAGPVPGIGTKICATVDPDGWKTVFVDEEDFLKELVEAESQA